MLKVAVRVEGLLAFGLHNSFEAEVSGSAG